MHAQLTCICEYVYIQYVYHSTECLCLQSASLLSVTKAKHSERRRSWEKKHNSSHLCMAADKTYFPI